MCLCNSLNCYLYRIRVFGRHKSQTIQLSNRLKINRRMIGLKRGILCFRLVKLIVSITAASFFRKMYDFDMPSMPVLNEFM